MRRHPRLPALLAALVVVLAGCSQPEPPKSEPAPPPPPTAGELLLQVQSRRDANASTEALRLAEDLISRYPDSEEARQAGALLPELTESIRVAEEAERQRKAEAAARAEAQRLARKWSYRASEDPMTSRVTRQASIESENTVDFDFPYAGPQHGTLILRDHPSYGKDVIFKIERGQILCHSYSSCDVRVRFDERSPERWKASEAADNDSTVIFLQNYSSFVQRLQSAEVVRVQVPVYQEGNRIFEFEVSGFDVERYRAAP
jgi:hypothetical protein